MGYATVSPFTWTPITISASTRNRPASGNRDVLDHRERVEHPLEVVLTCEPGDEAGRRYEGHENRSSPPSARAAPQHHRRRDRDRQRNGRHDRRRPLQRIRPGHRARRLRPERMDREGRNRDHDERRDGCEQEERPEDAAHPAIIQGRKAGGAMGERAPSVRRGGRRAVVLHRSTRCSTRDARLLGVLRRQLRGRRPPRRTATHRAVCSLHFAFCIT